jgi:hypothetical protein
LRFPVCAAHTSVAKIDTTAIKAVAASSRISLIGGLVSYERRAALS